MNLCVLRVEILFPQPMTKKYENDIDEDQKQA